MRLSGDAMTSSGVPCATICAAVDAGAGADVDDVVGGQDRVLVVLDDDHGVAEVAQVPQRGEQAVVVALVQADGRLVEHVEHAGQAGADLRGEPDALRSRRPTACRSCATASDSRGRRRSGTAGARGSPSGCAWRSRSACLVNVLGRSANQSLAARIDRSPTSPMCRPPILTASDCGFRR